MGLFKDPYPDPRVEPFRDGVASLRRDGELRGYVFTTVETFLTPFSPLRKQWWVWYITAWADGTRDEPQEDYPPWTFVLELSEGRFEMDGPGVHAGVYKALWLERTEAAVARQRFGITADAF